jgi:hypothetical protein
MILNAGRASQDTVLALSSASGIIHTINSRSKILMEHPNNIALMHLNTRTMRWSVARGPDR